MKNHILAALLMIFFSSSIYAQNIEVGTVFTINEVKNNDYKHIHFPKSNFIVKKGGIANYENIKGVEVEITSIEEQKDGRQVATIKLTSNKLFFNSHKYITVDINEAIANKELTKLEN